MMSKINQTDIDRLIELVGGRGNIATVSHCITRLRFVLNQPANARPKEIEQLPMVKGCFTNAGQFQVVIGTNVGDYYQALMNPLMILVKIIKLRWIHILSYDQMVSRKINNQTTRCANS
ncbi:glucose PTS transporter subunit EIIB, partial [Escherichia coli]|uniref:glucose PTS transporter subunit EIIB n=1 Tax=Escherichia coli TaxID=562 RepID=UPI0021CCD312